jgi:hypothetical protein
VEEERAAERQAAAAERAELGSLRKLHESNLRDERARSVQLANRLWRALERSLGTGAVLSLAAALEADGLLTTPDSTARGEAPALGLTRVLCDAFPSSDAQVSEAEGGYEIRLRQGAEGAPPAWLGVYAVQCLGSLMGKGLRATALSAAGADLIVRVRPREADEAHALPG